MDQHPDQKKADSTFDIHEIIKKRWSPRSFSEKPVSHDMLRQLFDAVRWAPSAHNEQPWRFIIAPSDEEEAFSRMKTVLNPFNRQWAQHAPVLGVVLAKKDFDMNGQPNKHAVHDVGQAMAYLTFEASRHDLFIHQMAGILPQEARELYHIPDTYDVISMFALGYLGDPEALAEKLREKETAPRTRLSIDEIAFRGQWDNPSRL